jgi:hypothetical protein
MKRITHKAYRAEPSRTPSPWPALCLVLISGCGVGVPIEEIEPRFEAKKLAALIGSQKDEVRQELGSPSYDKLYADKSYFVYESHIDAAGIAFIGFPVPVYGGETWICSLLEFDQNEKLKSFETYGTGGTYSLEDKYRSPCAEQLFDLE